MGLYVKMRDDLMRKSNKFGINADTAQKIAAHYANRYAGSLPTEGMSKVARNWPTGCCSRARSRSATWRPSRTW
jgi:hypothetical protein